MKRLAPADMPNWPRLMPARMAAAYLGISPTKFIAGVRTMTFPKPCRLGATVLWDRSQLDQYVDTLTGGEAASADHQFAEGLARARDAAKARQRDMQEKRRAKATKTS